MSTALLQRYSKYGARLKAYHIACLKINVFDSCVQKECFSGRECRSINRFASVRKACSTSFRRSRHHLTQRAELWINNNLSVLCPSYDTIKDQLDNSTNRKKYLMPFLIQRL